ncbi:MULTISPECIES: DUF2889 domain-containing protein [unclassified Paraburkholderia]|uniref:DUF2889 domain-containing protein n=1 Tax=unclassified Paraburkholderia TaxID=2615204 RepID=UPI0019821515|nr:MULTISPECIES: DUF2889 domain-containing protein [unclassified Paraburkholderia]MBN3854595.1 DUF2889 domain-containing protein [Paraburkholderia sp. Ac-20340]
MPLSPPAPRQLRHQRAIRAVAYEREDGLWDIDACLTDHKPRDVPLASGIRPNGLPIHELWLRITIDRKLNVVDAEASSDWVPYDGQCQNANPAYRALIGLNLLQNFRREAGRLLAGTAGCTHLTEMLGVLPTVAVQAFVGAVWDVSNGNPGDDAGPDHGKTAGDDTATGEKPPFQLGRCHALRFDGEAVKQFYPRWYGHAPRSQERSGAGTSVREDTGPRQDGKADAVAHE